MKEPSRPWPPGAVTGIGSLPGTDPAEALALVLGELPDLPFLPELPARGPGAAMIGRTGALLVDLPLELEVREWRIAAHPGADRRRAADDLARDLDALQEQASGYEGALKVQSAGPWTLAAAVELPTGHKIVTDRGAVRDLAQSLAEGLRAHLADVASRVPGAQLVLQLDEPALPAVLAGRVPTPSGYGTVAAIEPDPAEQILRDVLAAAPAGVRVVHCCAADAPVALLRAAGADAVALDLARLDRSDYDVLGEAVEGGTSLWLGVLPSAAEPDFAAARDRLRRLWGELGFDPDQLAGSVVATPACGLADSSPERVRRVLRVLRDLGSWLRDPGEDVVPPR